VPIENSLHPVDVGEPGELLPHLVFGCHQRPPDGQRPNLGSPIGDRVIDPPQLQPYRDHPLPGQVMQLTLDIREKLQVRVERLANVPDLISVPEIR
jgi:hypothetical protein